MKSKQCTPAGEWEACYMNMKRGENTAVIIRPHAQERRVCKTQLKAALARGKTPFPHVCVCVCGCYLILLTALTNSVIPCDYSPACCCCCCCSRQTKPTPARRCAAATAALILRDAFIIYTACWNWCLRVCNSIKLLQLKIIDLHHWLCSTGTKHCFFSLTSAHCNTVQILQISLCRHVTC